MYSWLIYNYLFVPIALISEIAHAHSLPLSCLSSHFLPRQQSHPLLAPALPKLSVPGLQRPSVSSLPSIFTLITFFLPLLIGAHHPWSWLTGTLLRISAEVIQGSCKMALKIPVSPRYFLTKKADNFFFPSQLYCCWLTIILCLINEHRFPPHVIF